MEADKIISSVEKYVREFILYLLSFFWSGRSDGDDDPIVEVANKTIIFSVISAAAGAYLWNRYIYGSDGSVLSLAGVITDSVLRWLSFGLFLYALMRLARFQPHILLPVLSVFKVFAVAHVVAIFGSYLAKNAFWMFLPRSDYLLFGPHRSAQVAYALQAVLMILYMPREISGILGATASRMAKLTITAVFLASIGFVAIANYLDPLSNQESYQKIAGAPKPAKEHVK